MHTIQSQLYADHYNFLRLLRSMESLIACYESGDDNSERLPAILDIFDYVQVYPERWHHPVEDVVFELLLKKQVENSEVIWGIRAEHKALEALTHQASELFLTVANDGIVPVEQLVSTTREFINRQLDHINKENRIVYPLLEKHLSDEDWQRVVETVEARRDPLFDESLRAEYMNLHKHIIRSERGVAIGATARAFSNKQSGDQSKAAVG